MKGKRIRNNNLCFNFTFPFFLIFLQILLMVPQRLLDLYFILLLVPYLKSLFSLQVSSELHL